MLNDMLNTVLQNHLDKLERDKCYRVAHCLKEAPYETTELVFFQGNNGSEIGPFIRKNIDLQAGTGCAYETIFAAWQQGKRFLYLPHILDCYSTGTHLVIIMEYIKGETLKEACLRYKASAHLAEKVFPVLCDAVCELHEGFSPAIIHRDLKPSNIMISFGEDKENGSREILENAGRGIPESTSCELSQSTGCRIPQNASYEIPQSTSCGLSIIDFGIARTFKNDAEQDTHHFGTRAYAPPEQFGFGQTDVRTDIYALGMILFFLLTGENPSANDRKNNFEKLRAFDNLRSVVVRATELDPKKRFSNVRELKQAFLQGIQESAPASAKNFAGSENLAGTSSFASTGRLTNANDFAGNLTAANNPSPETMPNPGFSPQEHSHAPHKETHGRQPHSAIGRFLSKIPEFPGVVWDILLLFFFGICCIGAVQNIIYPKNSTSVAASLPLPGRILAYGSVVLLVCGPVFFAICDRRPLLRAFPKLKKISLGRDFLTCFIVLIVGIFLVALSSNITY